VTHRSRTYTIYIIVDQIPNSDIIITSLRGGWEYVAKKKSSKEPIDTPRTYRFVHDRKSIETITRLTYQYIPNSCRYGRNASTNKYDLWSRRYPFDTLNVNTHVNLARLKDFTKRDKSFSESIYIMPDLVHGDGIMATG